MSLGRVMLTKPPTHKIKGFELPTTDHKAM